MRYRCRQLQNQRVVSLRYLLFAPMPKYSFVLVAALVTQLITLQPANAQKASPKPAAAPTTSAAGRIEALTTSMAQALSLTPAQTEKVRAINTTSVRNVEAARKLYSADPAKLRSYIDDVSLSRLDRLKEVLTPVQFARYQQKREEKMGIPTIRGNQGTPPPGLSDRRGEE
jgi:Spy/CpxP family protein refolding chaperone